MKLLTWGGTRINFPLASLGQLFETEQTFVVFRVPDTTGMEENISEHVGDVVADSFVLGGSGSLCLYWRDRVDCLVSIVDCCRSSLLPMGHVSYENLRQYLSLFFLRQISHTEKRDPLFGLKKWLLCSFFRHNLQFLESFTSNESSDGTKPEAFGIFRQLVLAT